MTLLRATRPLARRRGRAFVAAALAIGLGLLVPRAVPAHEGHVHEEEKVAPVPAVTGSPRSTTSDRHELLVRTEEAVPGTPGRVHLLLADLETNAPVEGATVEITVTGSDSSWTAAAIAPGIYEARLPDGSRALDVLVRRGEELDLLALDSIQVADASRAAADALAGRKRPGSALWIALLAAAIAIGGSIAAAAGLRKRRAAALVLLAGLGLAALTSSVSRAHEGELHGTEEEPHAEGTPAQRMAGPGIVPPGARYVAKEAQFEIGLRTATVREEALAPVRTAYGTVVADPGATARLVAPQTGRFVASRTWRLGDRITRGQLFGSMLVVDELPVRAPLAGTITTIEAVGGQTVAAGQVLATIVDGSRVRIEVPLYGETLGDGLRARGASVRLPALPERSFAARIEGLAPGGSSGGPAAPLVVSAANPEGLLRPGMMVEVALEQGAAEPALTVPASALVTTEQGPALFVKIAPEAFVLRAVELGTRAGARVAIARGVSAGERIVVHGLAPLLATAEAPR